MRKHTAAIDIRNKNDRTIYRLGKAHVGNIIFAKIHFCRTACALNNHHIVLFFEALKCRQYMVKCELFNVAKTSCVELADGLTINNDLRAHIRIRLQQYRVEVRRQRQTTGFGLKRLSPPDFSAIVRYRTVQCHVLRLKWRHRNTPALKYPT